MKKIKFISAALTALLVLSCFAMPFAGAAETEWGCDFESGTSDTCLKSNVDKAKGEIVDNPDPTIGGKVYRGIATDANGTVNADTTGITQSNSGTWVFETDFYLPSSYPSDAYVTFATFTGESDWGPNTTYLRLGGGSATTGTLVSSFPRDKWMTVRYVFEYTDTSGNCTVTGYFISENEILRVFQQKNVAMQSGLYKMRIQMSSQPKDSCFYLDNMKYYQKPQRDTSKPSLNAETHFLESFTDGAAYNLNATSKATTEGTEVSATPSKDNLTLVHNTKSTTGSTGKAEIVSDPAGGTRKALKVTAADALGTRNRISTIDFEPYLTGKQIAEADFYIPSAQIDTGTDNLVLVTASHGTWSGFQIRLLGNGNTTTETSGVETNTKTFPRDEWFTLRFVLNYTSGKAEIQFVENGTVTTVGSGDIPSALKTTALKMLWIDGGSAQKHFYIGAIRYYEDDCMPIVESFDTNTNLNVTITSTNVSYNKHNSDNWFMCPSGGAAFKDNEKSAWKMTTNEIPVGVRSGKTAASVDFKFDSQRKEGETIQVYAESYDTDAGAKAKVGDTITITGTKLWSGGESVPAHALTVNTDAWFTLRVTYDNDSNIFRYERINADGSTNLLGRAAASEADAKFLEEYGICGLTVQYDRAAGTQNCGTKWYIDNVKLSNFVLEELKLTEEGSDYKAEITYEAKGDTKLGTLLVAQYGSDGNLLALNVSAPEFTAGKTAFTKSVAKAEGAASAKLMLWEDLTCLVPMLSAE